MFAKYVVVNEYTLGYFIQVTPGGFTQIGILHGSVLRGSPHDWRQGYFTMFASDKMRPATEKDFEDYRVCLPPDFGAKVDKEGNTYVRREIV